MEGHYHAVVWIDSQEARLFHFNADDVEKSVVHPHGSPGDRHREKHTGHPGPDNMHFLEAVTEGIADAGAILITGPGIEKKALMTHIQEKHPRLVGAIEVFESADHPSDNELVAHARRSLAAADRMRP